jgi:hypothetical protein
MPSPRASPDSANLGDRSSLGMKEGRHDDISMNLICTSDEEAVIPATELSRSHLASQVTLKTVHQ